MLQGRAAPAPVILVFTRFDHSLQFTKWECAVFRQIKEAKESRGGVVLYAAQAILLADTELAEKSSSQP
ncbi:MAG: hypothetical protein C0623_04525 [Desulfuromonas sp.]|nr:MAG: hypothetical protein C0623_04525 [Desulfuromonas sp.]